MHRLAAWVFARWFFLRYVAGDGSLDDSTNSVEYEIFSVTELSSGKNFVIYTDPEKLREEMLALAPEDRGEINKLIGLIKTFSGFRIASGFFGAVRMGILLAA